MNNINSNWQTKKLGEILRLEYGKPLDKKDRDDDGKYPVYGANGIKNYSNKYFFNKGSIVVGRKGSAGELKLVKEKFWPLDVTYFVTFDEKKYDLNFIYYLLSLQNLTKLAKGVKPGINRNDVYSIVTKIPDSLSEQQRIVKILDDTFEKIEKVKEKVGKNLKNSKEVFESYQQYIFIKKDHNWEKKKFGECFKLKSGNNITSKMMLPNGKYPVYGGNGIAGRYNKYNLSGSNIIIGRVGALCGNVRHINENIWLTDNGFRIENYNYDFDRDFLTYLLNFKNLRSYARQAAQPVISNSSLNDVSLQFPKSIKEQQGIVNKLDKLSEETKKLEQIYKQKLVDLEELKKSILSKAFSGEL